MPNQLVKQITVPMEVDGVMQNVTFDICDEGARQMISDLGTTLHWVGVTTTALTDGSTTGTITVNGESVTVEAGAVAQYDGDEYVWNGTAWQLLGGSSSGLGALAFKNSAEATYTPAGSVSISEAADTTDTVNGITAVGTLPSFSYDSSNEQLTFNAGALPTQGSAKTFVTASGARTASFSGTQATITVS